MPTPLSIRTALVACLLAALSGWAQAALAVPVASAGAEDPVRTLGLGRKNPFRPLILGPDHGPALPEAQPDARPTRPRPKGVALTYVGLAYDGAESVAAVKVAGKVRFVRQGSTVAGATLQAITPEKLVWSKGGRRLESPLHRRPGVSP